MSYVAPDGNSYKNMIVSGSAIKLYTNKRLCFCNECKYQNNYIPIGLFRDNNDDTYACGIMTESGTTNADIVTNYYPSGSPVTPYKNRSDYKIWVNNNTPSVSGGFGCTQSDNPSIQIFSTKSDAYAYLTAPEVFQIPSFSFSGSILPGQNSSLSQGSCSLASPYTTSFSFEGMCIEKYSAPNGQVYNYKYSYYGVMTYQGFTADFDVYSNIKIGVLSTDRKAYALYNGVKTQVDISSAPAGTYTNASQGTSPNDDKVRYNGNTGTSNHIEHCYYSRSGVNGYTFPMTQQDGYPANFSTTFPTFSTESALLEYLGS